MDSHTGGEPTRLVIAGLGSLAHREPAELRRELEAHHDWVRRATVLEPRGSDVIVGAALCRPVDPDSATGVVFFNNTGYLGMCGHGTIGLAATLAHLGVLAPGPHQLDTPVGTVRIGLLDAHRVQVENVVSYRLHSNVELDVDGRRVVGDVAWGGNWFFLTEAGPEQLTVANTARLTDWAWSIRKSLESQGVTGADGALIDHIELFGPPQNADNHSRNFVLCPGGAYDRSPCGTGLSAKLACLFADGRLKPEQTWRQESIVGSVFEGSVQPKSDSRVVPTIVGSAYVTGESTLWIDSEDPFGLGITP